MTHPIYQIDAFTERAFFGNPAAVCLLESAADPAWMLNVAREMNLSETAFLAPGDRGFDLRWFTPAVEVDLCGHATLASAHILWETGRLAASQDARFNTRSGLLVASRRGDWIELNFPAKPVEPGSCASRAVGSAWRSSALCWPHPVRLPGGGGIRIHTPFHKAGFQDVKKHFGSWSYSDVPFGWASV